LCRKRLSAEKVTAYAFTQVGRTTKEEAVMDFIAAICGLLIFLAVLQINHDVHQIRKLQKELATDKAYYGKYFSTVIGNIQKTNQLLEEFLNKLEH
jgi:hypothetical protein